MLILNKHTLKAGVLAAALLGAAFAACNDSADPAPVFRSRNFNLVKGSGIDSLGVVGRIRVEEQADNSVTLSVTLINSVKDTGHIIHLLSGSAASPGPEIRTDTLRSTASGSFTKTLLSNVRTITVNGVNRNFTYDSAIAFRAFVQVIYSASKDSVMAEGNVLQ